MITVDTGISALNEAAHAKDIGLDFIITDHHEPPPVLPEALAIINPKQPGCPYPFKELAGVGVAFKVAHALLGRLPEELLDYAVIGTIADLVPLIDENRLLAKKGLRAIESSGRPGIRALKEVCGMKQEAMDADHIGFAIGPRLNAAGRLDSANPAVELLLADDEEEAKALATEIDSLNKERQAIVSKMTEEAIRLVETTYGTKIPHAIVVAKEGWNPGVIGIVASRLVEQFYRPTIVMSIDESSGLAKGSARSIEGFDMYQELANNRDILPHFGGHPMAAGMTLKTEDIDDLRSRLIKQAKETLTDDMLTPATDIDLVAEVEDVTVQVIGELQALAPFGVANRKPIVLVEGAHISDMRRIGSNQNHLKIQFTGAQKPLDGIAFRMGHLFEEITPHAKLSAIGTVSLNEWNGKVKPQLIIDDLAVLEWQLFDWRSIQPNRLNSRLLDLPREKLVAISFQEGTKERLGLDVPVYDYRQAPSFFEAYVVLLDLPSNRVELESLFSKKGEPSRVYVVFSEEEESFFQTNPNREQFKWYYGFIKKNQRFSLNQLGAKLEKHKGWSARTVEFMTTVFLELGFIKLDDGIVEAVENPEKKR